MRLHLVACSEQYLQQEPSGYAGGAFDVPALADGDAPLAVITVDGTAGEHANGGGLVKRKGGLVHVDIEQGLGGGPSPHGSKGDLDRSATTAAADRLGASRWGASYWTQVGRGVCVCVCACVRFSRFWGGRGGGQCVVLMAHSLPCDLGRLHASSLFV